VSKEGLLEQLGKFDGMDLGKALPPVDQWNPDLSGTMDLVIKSNGEWLHEGEPFVRDKLVRLFSTILKKEGSKYYLVTPVEKWEIQVEDLPFQVVLAHKDESDIIRVVTDVGDEFYIDPQHPLLMDATGVPFVEVRAGLMARFSRNAYYTLSDMAIEQDDGYFVISGEEKYRIG